jgi:hypothetical protein
MKLFRSPFFWAAIGLMAGADALAARATPVDKKGP